MFVWLCGRLPANDSKISFPAKKHVDSSAKHLSTKVFTRFSNAEYVKKSQNHTTSKVLKSFLMFLFCCVFWGKELFCLIPNSKESKNLCQNHLPQICEFKYQTIYIFFCLFFIFAPGIELMTSQLPGRPLAS